MNQTNTAVKKTNTRKKNSKVNIALEQKVPDPAKTIKEAAKELNEGLKDPTSINIGKVFKDGAQALFADGLNAAKEIVETSSVNENLLKANNYRYQQLLDKQFVLVSERIKRNFNILSTLKGIRNYIFTPESFFIIKSLIKNTERKLLAEVQPSKEEIFVAAFESIQRSMSNPLLEQIEFENIGRGVIMRSDPVSNLGLIHGFIHKMLSNIKEAEAQDLKLGILPPPYHRPTVEVQKLSEHNERRRKENYYNFKHLTTKLIKEIEEDYRIYKEIEEF